VSRITTSIPSVGCGEFKHTECDDDHDAVSDWK
jgi:hypothetical protein